MNDFEAERGRSRRVPILLLLALIGGVAIGQLGGRVEMVDTEPPPAVEPPATLPASIVNIDATPRADILRHARALRFETRPGSSDAQRLHGLVSDPEQSGLGPVVRIEPMAQALNLDRSTLGRGQIVARFINTDTVVHVPLALGAADTVYWWVDSAVTGHWRSMYFSSQETIPVLAAGLEPQTVGPGDGTAKRSLPAARWRWAESGERPWVTCAKTMACLAR